MNPRTKDVPAAERVADTAASRYVSELKASHGRYARQADETRRLVDESMGATSLTELLYKSRAEA